MEEKEERTRRRNQKSKNSTFFKKGESKAASCFTKHQVICKNMIYNIDMEINLISFWSANELVSLCLLKLQIKSR